MRPPALPRENDPSANKRHSGRLVCEELGSSVGPVVDLSGSGCRVICSRLSAPRVGSHLMLRLEGYESCVTVPVQIMRKRHKGLFAIELGLQFQDLSEESREAIASFARTHSVRYSFLPRAA